MSKGQPFDPEHEPYIPEFEEPSKEELARQAFKEKVIIREFAIKKNAVRILRYMKRIEEPQWFKEISDGMAGSVGYRTTYFNLLKLLEHGVIMFVPMNINTRKRYYQLNPNFPVQKILDKAFWHLGNKFDHLISIDGTSEKELVKNPEFLKICHKEQVFPEEALDGIEHCTRFIETKRYSNIRKFYRKRVGYLTKEMKERDAEKAVKEALKK